jgi:hypothetical protein
MTYRHVTPRDHDAGCRRGLDPCSAHYGLDRERCERCRNLWQRLVDAGERRQARHAEALA